MPPRRNRLPGPLPEGWVVTDTHQNRWRLGKMIGQGGFGLIYLGSPDVEAPGEEENAYGIKIEFHQNGPLFCELKFYQRAARREDISKWINSRDLDYLGIPSYWGSGETTYDSTRYRFMVIDRLGVDLHKIQNSNNGKLSSVTAMQTGIRMLDVLEYIHEHEYVHGDIKAANILLHPTDPEKVYLADYGLSYRYCPDGKHKEYKEDLKRCHNGTLEFTSLDAHKGATGSRRGDLEILAFCILHWLSGKLPWHRSLRDPSSVQDAKTKFVSNLPYSVYEWLDKAHGCEELAEFMVAVSCLKYNEKPNYAALRRTLMKALQSAGTRLGDPLDLSNGGSFPKTHPSVKKKQVRKESPERMNGVESIWNRTDRYDLPKPRLLQKTMTRKHNFSNNEDDDEYFPPDDIYGRPRTLQKRLDLYPDVFSIKKPMGSDFTQNYKDASDEEHWFEDQDLANEHRPDIHQQDHRNIYKYIFIVPVLLLMVYCLLYEVHFIW